jgi:hypothetical protein
MKARLIVFAAEVSLDTNQEVQKREKIGKRSYSMSQLGAYDKGKAVEIFQVAFDLHFKCKIIACTVFDPR